MLTDAIQQGWSLAEQLASANGIVCDVMEKRKRRTGRRRISR